MLRGAIDFVSSDRVCGWIYASSGTVRGLTVLAFIDEQCVGSGAVDGYRQDLKDAGLGDGHLGFDFDIATLSAGDEARVLVRLDGSDLALLQASSRVSMPNRRPTVMQPKSRSRASLEWMRSRGWLEQMEVDLLKAMQQFGVYDRSLRVPKSAERAAGATLLDAGKEAQEMFELLRMERVALAEHNSVDVAEIVALQTELIASGDETIVALWSSKRTSIMVVEGSHDASVESSDSMVGAVEFSLGPDRLLLLDLRCQIGAGSERDTCDLRVYAVSDSPMLT